MKTILFFAFTLASVACRAQIITTIAGNGISGFSGDGGAATAAKFNGSYGVAVDHSGNMYIADNANHRIRKVDTSGIINTFAGNGTPGYGGDGGAATAAKLHYPTSIAFDDSGNVYIADVNNYRIRKVNTSGIITTFAGNGVAGYTGDGGAATAAELNVAIGIAIDHNGNVYLADRYNGVVRKVDTAGIITTFAGGGSSGLAVGGAATTATLSLPTGVAVDDSGNVYIADNNNSRILKVNTSFIITSIAGNDTTGFSGDGGAATAAEFYDPWDVAVDGSGNIYIADQLNNRIRKVSTSGIITTIAGNGTHGYSGDGGPATATELGSPKRITVDCSGNVYIADLDNNRIRKVSGSATGSVASISGSTSLCVGAAVSYSDATASGVWRVSDTSVATINATGMLTAHAAGTDTIKYAVTSSCGTTIATIAVHIDSFPLLSSVSGRSYLCPSGSLNFDTLMCSPTGGTWSSSNAMDTLMVSGTMAIVSCATPGVDTVRYSLANGGCITDSFKVVQIYSAYECDSVLYSTNTSPVDRTIKIYPNPNTGIFTIELPAQISNKSIVLTDLLGKIVDTKNISSNSTNHIDFNINNLPAGTYFIKVVSDSGIFTGKILKMQ